MSRTQENIWQNLRKSTQPQYVNHMENRHSIIMNDKSYCPLARNLSLGEWDWEKQCFKNNMVVTPVVRLYNEFQRLEYTGFLNLLFELQYEPRPLRRNVFDLTCSVNCLVVEYVVTDFEIVLILLYIISVCLYSCFVCVWVLKCPLS